jgi:hypothetical protein
MTAPNDTVLDKQTLCTIAGVVICGRTDRYPEDEFDSELAYYKDIKCCGGYSGTFSYEKSSRTESEAIIPSLYLRAFPYTAQGVYNRSEKNCVSFIDGASTYVFGYDLDLNDPDPATRVSYPLDVDNASFSPVYMDYLTGRFNYGDWPSEPGKYFMPKPCMITDDGKVAHYLDPNDYSLQEDGVTPSYVSNTNAAVQAMMEWDKIYVYREETDGIYKFRCSDKPQTSDWKCWSNYDINDEEIDHFYTSIYTGVNATPTAGGMAFRSRSGAAITRGEYFYKYTGFIGTTYQNKGWYIGYLSDHLLIQDLLVMMGKSTDCQTVFGYGCTTGAHTSTGTLNKKGLFWGSASYDAGLGVKVFGMEDYWGNSHRYLAGWLSKSGSQYVKLTWGTADGSTKTGFAYSSTTGYIRVTTTSPTGSDPGYISGMETESYGRIPTTTSGSATTYECDQFDWSASSTVQVHLMGYGAGGTAMGPFAVYANGHDSAIGYASANLSYKPLAE